MIYNYDSSMAGAPVLSGTAGTLRSVIKACLVDGFGAGAVSSLAVSGGVATATFGAAHPYKIGTVVQIAGATPSGLNGQQRVLSVASGSITFAAAGVADGAASGTITHKVAAAGWLELFAGQLSNVIALTPSVAEATGCVLRVDDTGTVSARVVGYESMSDINTGVGPFPTPAQIGGGMYWPKSDAGDSSARAWRVIADARAFHLWVAPRYGTHGFLASYGDLQSYRSGDAWCSLLVGGDGNVHASGSEQPGCLGYGSAANPGANAFLARSDTGLGGAQLARKVAPYNLGGGYSATSGYSGNGWPYPNGADNSLRLSVVEVAQGMGGLRGRIAGLYHSAQVMGDAFGSGDRVDGQGEFAGRTFVALRAGPPGAQLSSAGTVFVDATGPWRI
ncbi:hypothetical protein [Paracidovorax cattleyae]|uniref:Uncharacterized protein n=1 Tax=Paracidovorax cattleyae TaxID=80868 RepID=A0A1H0N1T2_9BURK|nr:hypothetical protein [Paracidovorax cattleyae]AVS75638.1 hypothetical protein C8240_18065 [Paracidovorax cattleyae]SDO86581.1 hypothetical protein SAMN04489708_104161 [Paracidovorax cattleyae]